jgi:hypothetical protein
MPASGIVQTVSASLTSANIGSWAGSYGYKLDGNLENRTENGLNEPFEYDFNNDGIDESNMLSEISGNPVSWDKNGWLISDGTHCFAYVYDGKMQVATSLLDPDITVDILIPIAIVIVFLFIFAALMKLGILKSPLRIESLNDIELHLKNLRKNIVIPWKDIQGLFFLEKTKKNKRIVYLSFRK